MAQELNSRNATPEQVLVHSSHFDVPESTWSALDFEGKHAQLEKAKRLLELSIATSGAVLIGGIAARVWPPVNGKVRVEAEAPAIVGLGRPERLLRPVESERSHQPTTLADMQKEAAEAYSGIRAAFAAAGKDVASEAFHMHLAAKCSEEGGEALKAYLHATGWSRRSGPWDELDEELADMVVSAFLVAYAEGRDLPTAIAAKLKVMFSRGWKDPA